MKRIKALSITLALMLVFSLLPMTAFAEDEGAAGQAGVEATAESVQYDVSVDEVNGPAIKALESAPIKDAAGAVITIVNMNSSADPVDYQTFTSSGYSDVASYTASMPSAGTLAVSYYSPSYVTLKVDGNYYDDQVSTVEEGVTVYTAYWYVSAGNHALDISLNSKNNYAIFAATYAPATMNITAGSTAKTYVLGRPASSSTVSSFKVKSPGNGYIDLVMGDVIRTYNVSYKTAGFTDFETLTQKDAKRYIGVKSGVYTVSVKSYTPLYGVSVKYNKVTESKFGTKKSKAKSIKKNKTIKGLIIANAKKTHWYKFKNTKTKKVRITVKANICGGCSYGGIKVTLYDKRGSFGSRILYPGESYTFKPYTLGKGGKLVKGTYRIKVQSYKGGSGYFTVKWK